MDQKEIDEINAEVEAREWACQEWDRLSRIAAQRYAVEHELTIINETYFDDPEGYSYSYWVKEDEYLTTATDDESDLVQVSHYWRHDDVDNLVGRKCYDIQEVEKC